jgi:hypothetical protein
MRQYNFWYIYYDMCFLTVDPKFTHHFLTEYIRYNHRNLIPQAQWPKDPCPTLSRIYQLLEAFVLEPLNWAVSGCELQELEEL